MKALLKDWWDGKYFPPQNDAGGSLVFMQGHYEKHWSSKAAHAVTGFWLKYWQWCMGFGLAVLGLILKR